MLKKLLRSASVILVFIISAAHASADGNYAFQHLTTANGLTSNTVMSCVQDDFGFIWVATRDGIFRYDGQEFEPLETIDPKGNNGGTIISMTMDHNGVLWYCTDGNIGFYNTYTNESGSIDSIMTEAYYTIVPDYDNNLWFSGFNTTIRYDLISHECKILDIKSMQPSQQYVAPALDNNVWIVGDDGSILMYNNRTETIVSIPFLTSREIEAGRVLVSIVNMGDGIMLVSDNTGCLYRFDTWTRGRDLFNNSLDGVTYIRVRSSNEIWVGTSNGLYILDGLGNIIGALSDHSEHELSNSNVMSILQDRDDNIWVSTYHGGLNLLTNYERGIRLFPPLSARSDINGRLVRAITADDLGDLWVGTDDGCLCIYSPEKDMITDISALNDLPGHKYHSLLYQNHEMWAATYDNGIMVFDAVSGGYKRNYSIPGRHFTFMLTSREGNTYAGSTNGLFIYDPVIDSFKSVPETSGLFIHSIMQDSYGTIWLSCFGQGIWQKRSSSSSFIKIMGSDTHINLISEYISSMYEDNQSRIWVATEGAGVFYFSIGEASPHLHYLSKAEGFPSDIACSIIQDKASRIWVSSSIGLAEIDSQTATIKRTYLDNNSSFSRSFNHNAIYGTSDGLIYLGSYNGLVSLDPEDLSSTVISPTLYIKKVYNKRGARNIQFLEEGKSSVLSEHIKIHHKDASAINIDFSSPGFSSLGSLRYEYKLKGRGIDLENTTTNNSIVLNNLKPGKYTFTAGLSGFSSPGSTKSLEIEVLPSFFNSPLAKLLYALLAVTLLYLVLYQIREKRRTDQKLALKEMEKNKQKELYESRVSFFSYITHELRTPLTLIKLPVDKLINNKDIPADAHEDLLTIQSNTDRLIQLSSQFLEMSKMKSSDLQLQYDNVDIRKVVQKVCDYFPAAIKERNLTMKLHLPEDSIWINTAPEAVQKVMTNLVSNAVKYCSSRIDVSVKRQQDNIVARVNSDGPVISAEEAEKIFDPFYRIDTQYSRIEGQPGVGLGLPLSRSLALALGGSLGLDLEVRDCNSFVFTFPANPVKADALSHEDVSPAAEAETAEDDSHEGRKILIVEDAEDLREYIAKELGQYYKILTAGNGKEALGIIRSQKVDLVISDIVMPLMDGWELCRTIKNDTDLSYIPVILLTAIAGPESQISSLEAGADHYIEKPFSIELLKATVESLFHSREIIYKQLSESPLTHFNSITGNKIDQQFMVSLREIIIEHMSDENLDVEMLTTLMHTSTSTLYRKVKANTGLKVNEYIKICRLKKAAELLAQGSYKINEVAYLTGFSSASYFATSFLKQFNISPSNFVKSIKNEKAEN